MREKVDRRAFLAAAAVAAAGCLHEPEPDVDSRFSGEDCPSFRDTQETRCYHEVGTQPDVHILPEGETGDPTEEPMVLTLHNTSDVPVWSCPLSECWNIHKLIDGEWRSLTPFNRVPLVSEPLEPGESHTWELEMSEDITDHSLARANASEMAYTGPGTYAFSVSVEEEEEGGDEVELVALFEIDGRPLELRPSGAEMYEQGNGVVHARTDTYDEDEESFVLSATRSDGDADVSPIPAEIAAQIYPVRNVLAFFDDDTREVRLEGGPWLMDEMSRLREAAMIYEQTQEETLMNILGGSADELPQRFTFSYERYYYELSPEEPED